MPRAIGIDLGTTNSAMAVMEGGEPIATPQRWDDRWWLGTARPLTRTDPAVQGTFRLARCE